MTPGPPSPEESVDHSRQDPSDHVGGMDFTKSEETTEILSKLQDIAHKGGTIIDFEGEDWELYDALYQKDEEHPDDPEKDKVVVTLRKGDEKKIVLASEMSETIMPLIETESIEEDT